MIGEKLDALTEEVSIWHSWCGRTSILTRTCEVTRCLVLVLN